ncbi:unnamed protein product, partial [marine sediment metagenome]
PGWTEAHKGGTYKWREPDGNPAGHIAHHTGTVAYTPNREKANGYMGMGDPNLDNPRLYQTTNTGRVPIYTIANAQPGPVTAGYGVRAVLEDWVKEDIPFIGKQTQPDDGTWAGNTHYWNTENVLDGVGAAMPQEMWDTYLLVCQVINDVFGWSSARTIGHGQHTKRKIDLRDGRFSTMAQTIDALRLGMGGNIMGCPWRTTVNKGDDWYTTYAPCTEHYDFGEKIEWGKNTGACNVPEYAEASYDWAKATGRVVVGDASRDDYLRRLTDGRYLVMEHRAS